MDYSRLHGYLKYCSDREEVLKGIFQDHKIRFTQPAALNDPLESSPIIRFKDDADNYRRFTCQGELFPSEEERLCSQLIESQLNIFGILSLTKVWDSFDMWSHYANCHKGFLLEFKADFNEHPCMLSTEGECYPVRRVRYVDEYAVNIAELVDEDGWFTHDTANEQIFFTKTSRWKYEREYRLVRRLADHPAWQPLGNRRYRDPNIYLFEFSLDCIKSVTFGACMSVENKKMIMAACETAGIESLQACIIRDQKDKLGRPARVILIPTNELPNFLEMCEFIMEEKYIDERTKALIAVGSLEELPHYENDREWVEQYLRNRKARKAMQ